MFHVIYGNCNKGIANRKLILYNKVVLSFYQNSGCNYNLLRMNLVYISSLADLYLVLLTADFVVSLDKDRCSSYDSV